jgi:hypothetical protein
MSCRPFWAAVVSKTAPLRYAGRDVPAACSILILISRRRLNYLIVGLFDIGCHFSLTSPCHHQMPESPATTRAWTRWERERMERATKWFTTMEVMLA